MEYKKIGEFVIVFENNGFTAFQRYEVPNLKVVLQEIGATQHWKLQGTNNLKRAEALIKQFGEGSQTCARLGRWFVIKNDDGSVEAYCEIHLKALHEAVYALGIKKFDPKWKIREHVEAELTKALQAAIKDYETSVKKHKKRSNVKIKEVPLPYATGKDGKFVIYAPCGGFVNADFRDIWKTRVRKAAVKDILGVISQEKGFKSEPWWSPVHWGEQLVRTCGDGKRLDSEPFVCISNADEKPVESEDRGITLYCNMEKPVYAFAAMVNFNYDLSWDARTFTSRFTDYLQKLK